MLVNTNILYIMHISTTNQPKKRLKMTYQELMQRVREGALHFHHDAWARGYISRKKKRNEDYPVYSYSGRFGSGFVVYKPSFKSTSYYIVEYYIYN